MCEFVRQPCKCDFFFTYVAFYLLYLINNTKWINWLKLSVVETDHLSSSISEKKIQFFLCRMHSPQCLFYENWYKLFFSKLFTFVYKEMYLYRLFQVRSTKWTRSWIRKCFSTELVSMSLICMSQIIKRMLHILHEYICHDEFKWMVSFFTAIQQKSFLV